MIQNSSYRKLSDFSGLVKLKLTLAVVLSSVTGYYLYNGTTGISLLFVATGVFLLASGSAVLNQYTERSSDSRMVRTMNRPIPSGKVTEREGLILSIILLIAGSATLALNGLIPLLLGIFTVVLYNLVYTRLKKISIFAIIPGALVGAVPPMIGFSSAGGDFLSLKVLAFSGFMFLWQLPHFWLIIIKYGRDYSRAGFPNLTKYMSVTEIRNLVFTWVLLSTFYLFVYFLYTEPVSRNLFILLFILNISFITLFYRMLFSNNAGKEIKSAFILINSFSLFIMIFLITVSILKGI